MLLEADNMLVFFLICTCLKTLQGKPLPPLASSSGVNANLTGVIVSQYSAAADNEQLRTVNDIVKTCLFTIFACVWKSIHPNINGIRDSWWTRTKRRMVTTLYAVIAPEMVLLWALAQLIAAKEITEAYNQKFQTLKETERSSLAKIKQLFQPLPKLSTRRGARQPWTITHGFFIQMGGFILYNGEYPKEVLDYDRLALLLWMEAIDAPTVTERDLQDRSKGDTISKAIVVLQATWFILQCAARIGQRLPLSELEVLTLAFAVMNAAIYTAWWNKPQGVDMAICVPLKQAGNRAHNSHPASPNSCQAPYQHSDNNQPLMPLHEPQSDADTLIDEESSSLRHKLQRDRDNYSFPVFLLVCFPYRIVLWLVHPMAKMLAFSPPQNKKLRMSIFYFAPVSTFFPESVAGFIGIIFGAIHLLGWPLEFPLPHDRILWRTSALILTVIPAVFLVGVTLYIRQHILYGHTIFILGGVLALFYIAARFIVISIAVKSILHPHHNVLLDIVWTRYIPHF